LEDNLGAGGQGRRVRRNRRRVAGEVDRDLELLGGHAAAVAPSQLCTSLIVERMPKDSNSWWLLQQYFGIVRSIDVGLPRGVQASASV
jgi:hypothetical protein